MKKAVLALLLVLPLPALGAVSDLERQALIALYKSTSGDNWTRKDGWLGPPGTECSWHGVSCPYGAPSNLLLADNNLVGPIPPELENLKNLIFLDLHNNHLSGHIPPGLAHLKMIVGLDLSHNQLSGTIPPGFGNFPQLALAVLNLSSNELSGSIPPELGTAPLFMRLDLSNNRLSGGIPPELGRRRSLLGLFLGNNELSGSIPAELAQAAKLGGLALSGNKLSGSIPAGLASLKDLQKDNCDFRYNALHTDDVSLRNFLSSKQIGGDWEGTQTVAPTNVTADAAIGDSIRVSWTPIRFKEFGGGYRVLYSTSSGGPYSLSGTTNDKNASSLTVTGLRSGMTYYFVVQAVTAPHEANRNAVMSEYSKETNGIPIP